MAEFPNDSELHHVSGVEVPDDANHYAVKDDYARELINILNREKSEVYITKPGVKPSPSEHHMGCYFSSKEFRFDENIGVGGIGAITLASVFINVVVTDSIIGTHTVDISDNTWMNLDYFNTNTRVVPIRMSFNYSKNEGTTHPYIWSDIILSYSYISNEGNSTSNFFSGTGVIYTGTTVDDCVYVLVKMKLQETDGKKQAVITVTELPKELSGGGGSVNAVATRLPDGTATLSFS